MSTQPQHSTARRLVAAFVLIAPVVASAQSSISVSTGDLRMAGQPALSMLTLSPQVNTSLRDVRIWSSGQLAIGSSSGSTRSALETTVGTARPLLFGISPVMMLRGQNDPLATTTRNRRLDGALGIRIGTDRLGATATIGRAESVHGTTNRSVQTTSANLHVARGGFQLRVGYTGNAFDAASSMPTGQSGFALSRTRLSDFTTDGSWKVKRFEMGGFVGRRVGGATEHAATWGGAFAAVTLNDRVALVARQESAPSDPTRHLAAQRSTSIGFRIRPSLSRARFDDGSDAGQFRREFILTRQSDGSHGLRVYQPGAHTVELAGSFNECTPRFMRRAGGGWWELQVPLAPGIYNFNVRSDGGRWQVPPGLQTVADEFNGTVGVIVVP